MIANAVQTDNATGALASTRVVVHVGSVHGLASGECLEQQDSDNINTARGLTRSSDQLMLPVCGELGQA